MNVNDLKDFKIIYGANQAEIEAQIETLQAQGYELHGTIVAQPNPGFYTNPSGGAEPFQYYQMLARLKKSSSLETDADNADADNATTT